MPAQLCSHTAYVLGSSGRSQRLCTCVVKVPRDVRICSSNIPQCKESDPVQGHGLEHLAIPALLRGAVDAYISPPLGGFGVASLSGPCPWNGTESLPWTPHIPNSGAWLGLLAKCTAILHNASLLPKASQELRSLQICCKDTPG